MTLTRLCMMLVLAAAFEAQIERGELLGPLARSQIVALTVSLWIDSDRYTL